jgi:hypothetical protein
MGKMYFLKRDMNCRKYNFLLAAVLLTGCIYDPPQGTLTIYNYTDSAIYIAYSCNDSIPYRPKLEIFEKFEGAVNENPAIPRNPIISPNYRVNAYSSNSILGFGSMKNRIFPCGRETLKIFFITEYTMRTKSWEEIYRSQLYNKKISLNKDILDSLDWLVLYKGN